MTIGEYTEAANQHRPADPDRLAIEIQRLALLGWTMRDISTALRLDISVVARLLVREVRS